MSERDSSEAWHAAMSGPLVAADAAAVSRALLQAFDAEKGLGGGVKRAARSLRHASDALRVAWEANVRGAIAATGGTSVRRADLDEDAVWTALHLWLSGWAALPEGAAPERDTARALLAEIFPDGVSFVELTYALEWAEADRRVALLEGEGRAARIEALGGGPLLGALRAAHAEYERVLGIAPGGAGGEAGGEVIQPLLEDARRELIAYAEAVQRAPAGELRSESQRAALLAPLRAWAAHRAARAGRQATAVTAPG